MKYTGLDPERYSIIPGVRKNRQSLGCERRKPTIRLTIETFEEGKSDAPAMLSFGK